MLINPFRQKKSWHLLLLLAAFFLCLFAAFGVVMANDSYTYLVGGVRVSPLYPALIALLRALCGEAMYLPVLVLLQELLAAYAIFSLISFVHERFSLTAWLTALLSLAFAGTYVLRLVLVGPEALYSNAIMTESIAYPLYFLFVKYAFAAWDERSPIRLLPALVLALLLALTRGQLICLFPVLVILFLLLRPRGWQWLKGLLFGAAYFAAIALISMSYHLAVSGVFSTTTMGRETVLGALMYNSEPADAAVFAANSPERTLLFDTLTQGEELGLTCRSAPGGFIGRFKHYEASHDELRILLLKNLEALYAGEGLNDDGLRLLTGGLSDIWIPALLKANFWPYMQNCAINALGGLVRTNSIMRPAGIIWSALLYALGIFCLIFAKGRRNLDGERRFLTLILLSALINALFCSFGVFELSRYVYYNFPCLYLALALFLVRGLRLNKR